MKLVTFMNSERCDFVYYIGRIISEMTSSVIIIDNSETHELFRAVLNPVDEEDNEQDMIVRRNITYLKDIAFSPEFFPSFDYILVHQGANYDGEYIENSNEIFSMPDFRPDVLRDVPELPDRTIYILRDNAGKVNLASAAQMMDILPEKIVGTLDYDAEDYAHYISLLYNGRQRLTGLSESMIQALAFSVAKITGKDEKAVIRALKKERKSKS